MSKRLLHLPERAAIAAASIPNTKTASELLQGFLSREFIMHFLTMLFGMALLWRNPGDTFGLALLSGSVSHYGILRTTDKRNEKKAKADLTKADIEAEARVEAAKASKVPVVINTTEMNAEALAKALGSTE